ncbi:hypothetical protein [Taklimakanibacter deserti]|uniref:hypothetical protein n=1 Tax=Taklimakanibacter deserti TaxID=2267839 RepID=UPI0013C450F3
MQHNSNPIIAVALVLTSYLMLADGPRPVFAADEVKKPTAMPRIVGCSDSQRSRLEDVYKRAHAFVWRTQRFADALNSITRTERERLWRRERVDNNDSVSPHTWFGSFDGERSNIMREGLKKAEQRFRGVGKVKIRELRCGQPIAASANEHTDVCPAVGTGGGWPSAFHAPPRNHRDVSVVLECDGQPV